MDSPARLICVAVALAAVSSASWAQTTSGSSLYAERCAVCHGAEGGGGQGPPLQGVIGRQAGTARFGYSQAMRGAGFTWTAERLDTYLADPAAVVPGTSMVLQTPDAAARRAIIGLLGTLRPGQDQAAARPGISEPAGPTVGRLLTGAEAFGDWRSDAVFASGLRGPFGMAFYPPGPNPQFLYVALNNQVVRFPYQAGDTAARGTPEVVVPELAHTTGGHTTRDVAFAPDGSRMFVSVGSGSNVAEGIGRAPPNGLEAWRAQTPLGAAWGSETARADVLSFKPDGSDEQLFATGIRNCVGLAVQPANGALWCSTNERDGLGDNVPPDYVTRVRAGAYYGWPWYYIGDHEDPRHRGERPDLAGKMTEPDVLLQPHSASLQMTFYPGAQFPRAYWGDAFAAEHGSWNRGRRTGYKLVRIRLDNGVPTGVYEDFLTGFVVDDESVWGRPVGVTAAADGALLVSEDGNGTIWRVAYEGKR